MTPTPPVPDEVRAALFNPDESNSWAFPADNAEPAAPSPIDLRPLNERIAGERGPLRLSPEGNDILYADGRRFTAWAVHMPHGCDYDITADGWSFDDYRRSARFLARLGVNLGAMGVINPGRLDDPFQINPVAMTMIHRTHAAAREAGIYTQLRICWYYSILGGPMGIPSHEKKDLHCFVFFHPRVQEIWKTWVRTLLSTPNPHTGIALKDDYALCSVEITNEDSMLFHVTDGVQGEARHLLEERFFRWAVQRHGSAERALAAWDRWHDEADRPELGRFGVVKMIATTRAGRGTVNEQRTRDQYEFLIELSRDWNREAARYIREEVGARHVLVAASNFIPSDRVTGDDALRLLTWEPADLTESNHYFEDGGKPFGEFWRADAGAILGLRSAARDPLGLPTNKRQREGHPFWCTEILWPRPHPREVEGPLFVAAYQCLTGIDALLWAGPRDITWEGRGRAYLPDDERFRIGDSVAMSPFACAGPSTLGQFPAAAAILRLGLLREAAPVVREQRTREQILARELPATTELFAYDPTQFANRPRQETELRSGVPQEAFLVGPVRVALGEQPAPPVVADLSAYIQDGRVTSATGEIVVDTRQGLLRVDAPCVQAVAGFLADAGEIRLSQATLRSSTPHGTLAVVALDARPLSESRRILLQLGTRAVPTGWKEQPDSWVQDGATRHGLRVLATGNLPWRVQNASASVRLERCAATRATALDGNGNPRPEVPVAFRRDGAAATVEFPAGTMYVVLES